jgi:hypothetical protein
MGGGDISFLSFPEIPLFDIIYKVYGAAVKKKMDWRASKSIKFAKFMLSLTESVSDGQHIPLSSVVEQPFLLLGRPARGAPSGGPEAGKPAGVEEFGAWKACEGR